ncbi:Os10g0534801, partial [Oryza sativa Japonica Group]
DDVVDEGGGVGDAPPAVGLLAAVAVVLRDGDVAAAVHPGVAHVVDARLLARLPRHGPRVERVGRVVGALVPVEEGAHRRLHLPRRQHAAHHHHGEPPRHRHRPVVLPVVAHRLLRHRRRVQPHRPVEQLAQRAGARRGRREHRLEEVEVVERHQRRHRVGAEEAEHVAPQVALVETRVARERHAELRHARVDAVVAAVQRRVAVEATVLHLGELLGERAADGEAPAAERHAVGEDEVLDVALRRRPDVVRLPVVVLREHVHQVLREEHRVVVAHDEPPDAGEAEPERLGDDAGDPQRRPAPGAVGVGELGRVGADHDRREPRAGALGVELLHRPVHPHEPAHPPRPPPQLDVLLPALPQRRRRADAERDVPQPRRRLVRGPHRPHRRRRRGRRRR